MVKVSPKAKILLYVLLVIAVVLFNSLKADLFLLVAVIIFASGVKLSDLSRGIVPITLFLIFTFLSNVLFQTGRIIYDIRGIEITEEGLLRGSHLTLSLIILILAAKMLTATTTADELIRAVSSMLGPVGRLRSVREFIFTASLTLRFLPIVYDEAQTLYRESVKESTGIAFADKLKLSVFILGPLFERSMKRVSELKDSKNLEKWSDGGVE